MAEKPERNTRPASIELDRDLRVARFTPAATAFFDLIDADVGRSLSNLAPRFVGADLLADAREVLREPKLIERTLWSSEAQSWFTARVMPRVPPEAASGVVISFQAVTDFGRSDAVARRLAAVVRDSNDAITMQALDGRILAWNRGAERMYGYTEAEALLLNSEALVPEEARAQARGFLDAILRGEEVTSLEVKRLTKDGRVLDVWLTLTKLVDDDGRVVAVATTERDVTERKRAEAEARRLATVLRDSNDAVMVRDFEGRILAWNRGAERMYGYSEAEALGMNIDRLVADEEGRALARATADAIGRGEELGPVETKRRTRDGRVLDVWLTRTKLVDDRGRPIGIATTERDITERKQLVASLLENDWRQRALLEQMREADRNRTQFLAILSHELRNPLAPIRSSLYILDRVPPGGEQAQRALAAIDRQVSHLTRLVDDLLDVTRITRGKIELHRGRLDLVELVRRTVEDHRAVFASHDVALEVDLPTEARWISGDGTRLAQVVGNLLQNAAKFTQRGGRATVSVSRDQAGRAVTRVRDNGMGIVPEMLSRIFEPFAQADTSLDRSRGGLGLGLALVKGLTELHGGEVTAHSDGPGKGAEFTVVLPLEVPPVRQPALRVVGSAAPHPCRVLVIEDSADAAEMLRTALELGGHEVEVAYDGCSGIAKARSVKPEVGLCDIGLPGMNGYQVAHAFRADEALRAVHLIALTGYAQAEDRRRASEAGFEQHVKKPVSLEELEEILRTLPTSSTDADARESLH